MAQIAAMAAGELLALARHLRPRLVPGEEPPTSAVAERLVRMSVAAKLGWARARVAWAAAWACRARARVCAVSS